MNAKDLDRAQVVHSSLKDVKRIGIDSEFPNYPPSIGLIVRKGTKGYLLTTHSPKLSSTVTGEGFEFNSDPHAQNLSNGSDTNDSTLDDLDTHIRSGLLVEAANCRILAADLLEHAKRLELESRKDILIEDKNIEDTLTLGVQADKADKNHANNAKSAAPSTSKSTDPQEDDLDIFD